MLALTFILFCLAMAAGGVAQVVLAVVTLASLGLTIVNALQIR